MDALISKPYGLELFKKDDDYLKVRELQIKIFKDFFKILNQHHGINYSEKFWTILTGHWFELYINFLYKTINTIKDCINLYDISGTTIHIDDHYNLATLDYSSAISALEDVKWNDFLIYRILTLMNNDKFPIEILKVKNKFNQDTFFKIQTIKKSTSVKKNFLDLLIKSYSKIANNFVKNEDAFIINTYLPYIEEIKLQFALGQFPQIRKRESLKIDYECKKTTREKLTKKLINKTSNDLEDILRILLFENLPVCYLEGFEKLNDIVTKLSWPKSPKFIFTSNNFHTDEIFKLWTGIRVENGVKYYIGQHGNNYFTKKHSFTRVEEETSDKFFTWGWNNDLPKFVPAFIFKTAGKKKGVYSRNGGLLLIEEALSQKFFTWDNFSRFENYFKNQKEFVNKLNKLPRKKLTIRLAPQYQNNKQNEKKRWLDFDSSLRIDSGSTDIRYLISRSRLVVHSYDSTGLLETLSLNVPTLAFWQDELNHLHENIKPHYQKLVDVGVIHLNIDSVTSKINDIWDDIDTWWYQENLQNVIKEFCDKFAKDCSNPSKKMASLLVEKEI